MIHDPNLLKNPQLTEEPTPPQMMHPVAIMWSDHETNEFIMYATPEVVNETTKYGNVEPTGAAKDEYHVCVDGRYSFEQVMGWIMGVSYLPKSKKSGRYLWDEKSDNEGGYTPSNGPINLVEPGCAVNLEVYFDNAGYLADFDAEYMQVEADKIKKKSNCDVLCSEEYADLYLKRAYSFIDCSDPSKDKDIILSQIAGLRTRIKDLLKKSRTNEK